MARLVWSLVCVAGGLAANPAAAELIDFEGLADGTVLTTQIAGATVSNAIVLSSGLSLNEFEFPPHSGLTVVSDDGGAMQIVFDAPVMQVSGFFTYAVPLALTAFDAGGNAVATATSLFANNLALSGAAGSSANELIALSFSGSFTRMVIQGHPAGGSFVIDDLNITAVPEASTYSLMLSGLLMAWIRSRRLRDVRK